MDENICEVCGKRSQHLSSITIEGSEMLVCKECMNLGEPTTKKVKKARIIKDEREETLVENYAEIIKQRIYEKYGELKEFCKHYNYKQSYLKKILDGELPLSIEEARRLEKILRIKLVFIESPNNYNIEEKKHEVPKLTLGDLIKEKLNL